MSWPKRVLFLVFGVAGAFVAMVLLWPLSGARFVRLPAGDATRGAYLARMGGCIACHTDSRARGKPLAGGAAIETPFGVFRGPNLTQDKRYGIGSWTAEQFATAVRDGISPSGSPYYPVFPYTFFSKLTDQDMADLYAAFKTVPAVAERSKPHALKFPYDQRPGLKVWRAAFFSAEPFTKVSGKSAQWNRGAYIVEAVAHCGACHTPRNTLGARIAGRRFEGASGLPGGDTSPAITTAALKKAGWGTNDIVHALRFGLTPKGDSLGGTMGEVVREGTRFLTDDDLKAIATYLLDESGR